MITIRGGEVMTPEGWVGGDVLVEGGRVTGVGTTQAAETELDATGCLVGPGFVDLHTHLREPGQTWKEDIASGSAAAVAGGFTAVVAMPNTEPPVDSPEAVDSVLAAGVQAGLIDVIASGALTKGREGGAPADIEGMYRVGVRLFTDDGDCVADDELLGRVMTAIARLPGALVAQHAEDTSATTGAHMHEGVMSRKLGVGGMAAETEADVVRRDLSLVAATGVRYHCQHVSAMMTIDLIRAAKDQGLAVTAEVTPHHLSFDESALHELDSDFKMYPPLRSSQDRQALVAALRDGTVDAVATDHAPHLPEEKATGFANAPRGVIGLETAASAVWEVLGEPQRLFEVLSTAPARILGLGAHGHELAPGSSANLVVFDPGASWTPEKFRSKSSNSPYRGRTMHGAVRATIRRGELVYQGGGR